MRPEVILELAEKVEAGLISEHIAFQCCVVEAKDALKRRKAFLKRTLEAMKDE